MIVKKIFMVLMVLIVMAALLPTLLPLFWDTDTDIQAMPETDAVTVMLQTVWPILLLVIGVGIVIGLVVFALRQFKVI